MPFFFGRGGGNREPARNKKNKIDEQINVDWLKAIMLRAAHAYNEYERNKS